MAKRPQIYNRLGLKAVSADNTVTLRPDPPHQARAAAARRLHRPVVVDQNQRASRTQRPVYVNLNGTAHWRILTDATGEFG